MSGCNCCFLTCIQISQEAGKIVWYSHLLKNFPQFVVIHTVKGFSTVNETEVFLEFPGLFCDPTDDGNSISGPSAFSKSSLYIRKFSVHVLLKPSLKDFEHYLLACKMSTIVRQFENSVAGENRGEATKKGGRQAFVFNSALINQDKKQPRTGGEKQVRKRLKGRSAGQTITKSPRKR